MSLNFQCARLNLRALYGLISSTKCLELLINGGDSTLAIQGQLGR